MLCSHIKEDMKVKVEECQIKKYVYAKQLPYIIKKRSIRF